MLHISSMNGYIEIAQKLVELGLDVNSKGQGGFTPLHLAAKGEHEELVKWIVG